MSDTTESFTYTCPCGAVHRAGTWGAAHWHEILTHTCGQCGRQNDIRDGRVVHSKPQVKGRKV